MQLRRITLQTFRNITLAELTLSGRQQFFVGANGQGKTNLLEAVGFVSALRSFRTTDNKVLIQEGKTDAAIAADFEHETLGFTNLIIKLRPSGKEVACDGERVERFGDYLGRFPTVVFSSQDQQLVRGAPSLRRRWLDLTLAAVDPAYMRDLQTYHRALAGRNKLLKHPGTSVAELAAFEHLLAEGAAGLATQREAGLHALGIHVAAAYERIAAGAEPAGLRAAPDATVADAAGWRGLFERNRQRDRQFRTTLAGPHRDDIIFTIGERAAKDYGSEGQQRSLVLALRLAQMTFFRERTGVEPILLADDVLGELDKDRRRRFWASLGESRQVIATGTALPDAELGDWQVFNVNAGQFSAPS